MIARVTAREKLSQSEKKLSELLKEELIIKVLQLFVQKATKHYLEAEQQTI
jgi:hypothetical protein